MQTGTSGSVASNLSWYMVCMCTAMSYGGGGDGVGGKEGVCDGACAYGKRVEAMAACGKRVEAMAWRRDLDNPHLGALVYAHSLAEHANGRALLKNVKAATGESVDYAGVSQAAVVRISTENHGKSAAAQLAMGAV